MEEIFPTSSFVGTARARKTAGYSASFVGLISQIEAIVNGEEFVLDYPGSAIHHGEKRRMNQVVYLVV